LGEGFCKVHHKQPFAMLRTETEVKTDDLAIRLLELSSN